MRDLEEALLALDAARPSPVEVRRAFRTVLTLSQQLTEMMRTEFRQRTGRKWQAGRFPGWNATTELFKLLRRLEYHEAPIEIGLRQEHRFLLGSIDEKRLFALSVHSDADLDDPFAKAPPRDFSMESLQDPANPTPLPLIGTKDAYIIITPTKALRRAVAAAGNDDLHVLSRRCVETLRDYHQWYHSQLAVAGHGA